MLGRIDDYLDYHARVHAEVVFVNHEQRSFTFSRARERIDHIAGRLAACGLAKGDRLALLGRNSIEFFFMYLACARLGVVPVGINYRLTPRECAFIIEDSTAKLLFADEELIASVAEVCPRISAICLYGNQAGFSSFKSWLGDVVPPLERASLQSQDVMSQMYTSGTTGQPKGVLLSHGNIISNVYQTALGSEYTWTPGDEFLLVAPMYHAAGIMIGYTGVLQGLTLVIHREYDSARVVETLHSRPISAVTLVPAMLQMIVETIPRLEAMQFPDLRLIYYGASPIAVPLLRKVMAIFECDFTQGYGQTETNSIVAMLSASDHRRALADRPDLLESCGRAAFDTELAIVDGVGRPLPVHEAGEIVVRGPQIMQGYWNKAEATDHALQNGWLHTGDVGKLDDEGYLTVVGRLRDLIISGGENVYPVEIENVLTTHPSVTDAAVIGVSHSKWGEVPLAILVVQGTEPPTEKLLQAFCSEQLARFKVPTHVHFVDQIPRNPSGKILKQQLRDDIGAHYDE
ncbi:MAG: long-chain-fatty-acid--CoA ligase [Halieaceae bacterium]|nr:long-chain-fatty-acid--CoA ligase [Halieaceae bacterium]